MSKSKRERKPTWVAENRSSDWDPGQLPDTPPPGLLSARRGLETQPQTTVSNFLLLFYLGASSSFQRTCVFCETCVPPLPLLPRDVRSWGRGGGSVQGRETDPLWGGLLRCVRTTHRKARGCAVLTLGQDHESALTEGGSHLYADSLTGAAQECVSATLDPGEAKGL